MSDPTDGQQAPHRFQPGQSGNPAGRPRGSRNKLAEDFVQALAEDFKIGGKEAIVAMRTNDPGKYVTVVASLLPKHVEVKDVSLDELGRDELATLLDAVRAARIAGESTGEGVRH